MFVYRLDMVNETGWNQGRIQSRETVDQAISRGHLLGMKLN
jgi:hypothetical protein